MANPPNFGPGGSQLDPFSLWPSNWGASPLRQMTLAKGMISPGNIDLNNRPIVRNFDGSISTVRSITVTDDKGHAWLIPTVIRHPDGGGVVVSPQQAIAHFQSTGENLGYFKNEAMADAYAQSLHESQAAQYLPLSTQMGSVK